MPDRAVLFIDGNNWFHALGDCGVADRARLDYRKIATKLVGPRVWTATRYYIGALKHYHRDYSEQRRFLAQLHAQDPRISVHFGRIEDKKRPNELSRRVLDYLDREVGIPHVHSTELRRMAVELQYVELMKEKATDVLLAVELCQLARDDGFDAAYLLSADGDFTPAVDFTKGVEKKVYAVSPIDCAALRNSATAYIQPPAAWFADCYL